MAEALDLPQSTVSSNVQILVDAGLVATKSQKARKGSQKICHSTFSEILIAFKDEAPGRIPTAPSRSRCRSASTPAAKSPGPAGCARTTALSGLLDVPETFLDPDRMKAGLLWFTRGFVEYQFPNNSKLTDTAVAALEITIELSTEVPGTAANWPSDITLAINGHEIATWTSPGDFGDKRGKYTPDWWKLKGSQYGKLKTWRIDDQGHPADGDRCLGHHDRRSRSCHHRSIRLQDRGQGRRQASRRAEHLRQRVRQPRPGHRPAADPGLNRRTLG